MINFLLPPTFINKVLLVLCTLHHYIELCFQLYPRGMRAKSVHVFHAIVFEILTTISLIGKLCD